VTAAGDAAPPLLSLADRRALVTGASAGIGAAVAERLASLGADVAVCARRGELLEDVAARVRAAGTRARVLPVDVGDLDACGAQVRELLSEWGGLDILVNNAGVLSAYPVDEMTPDQWDGVMHVNLRAPVFLTQAVLPSMREQGSGSIVAIGSSLASSGGAGMEGVDYNVSKVGLQAWVKTLAAAVGPAGVRANCVACGAIDTPMHAAWREALIDEWEPRIPLRRIGAPEDVADVVAFLASDASRYVTGQTIHVNGGLQGSYA
jgi:3-oxoacyl-[acyl-carrier protein] reductase